MRKRLAVVAIMAAAAVTAGCSEKKDAASEWKPFLDEPIGTSYYRIAGRDAKTVSLQIRMDLTPEGLAELRKKKPEVPQEGKVIIGESVLDCGASTLDTAHTFIYDGNGNVIGSLDKYAGRKIPPTDPIYKAVCR